MMIFTPTIIPPRTHVGPSKWDDAGDLYNQGTIGCTPKSVPMLFIVFSRVSWGLYPIKPPGFRYFSYGYVGRGTSNYPVI